MSSNGHTCFLVLSIFTMSVSAERLVNEEVFDMDLKQPDHVPKDACLQELKDEVARVCNIIPHEIVNCANLGDKAGCCARKYCGYAGHACHFLKDIVGNRPNECSGANVIQYGILPAMIENQTIQARDVERAVKEVKFVISKAPRDNFIIAVYDIVAEPDRSLKCSRNVSVCDTQIKPISKRMDPGVFAARLSQQLHNTSEIQWRLYRTIRTGEKKADLVAWVNEAALSIKTAGGVLNSVVIAGNSRNNKALRTEAAIRAVAEAVVDVQVGSFANFNRMNEVVRAMRRFACGASFLSSQILLDPTSVADARAVSPHMYISTTLVRMGWTLRVLDRLGVRWQENAPPPVLEKNAGKEDKKTIWTRAENFLADLLEQARPGPIAFETLTGGPKTRLREINVFFKLMNTSHLG